MTKVKIKKQNNQIIVVEAIGHTGYQKAGEDIVCAALSSVLQTAALGILQVANIPAKLVKDDKTGYFKLTLPTHLSQVQQTQADAILSTMLLAIADLQQGYSNYIKLEVL